MKDTAASKIFQVLEAAGEPLSVEDICRGAFKRTGARERALVHINVFRLDDRGLIEKIPAKFRLRRRKRDVQK